MKKFAAAAKALGDTNRIRALLSLRKGELCLCQIIELLGLAPSTISKHMSILRQAGLVESRKEERWIYYRLAKSRTSSWIDKLIALSIKALADDESIKKDWDRLGTILKIAPETICKKHRS
jgi:ArsR family transcriptional regulator, arsenate/arsenite/antimonite-responsive transcriptional repressor